MARSTIDASVVLAHLLNERRPGWVDETIAEVKGGLIELIAPSLLWLEIGECLVRTRVMSDEFALEAMLRAETLGIEPVHLGRPLQLRALTLARLHGLSMYDAAYFAVAESEDAPLLTLDRKLERAARSMGLARPGADDQHVISEPSAAYAARPVDTTSLAAIGAALAEMRSEYAD